MIQSEQEPPFVDVRVSVLADARVAIVGLGLMGGSLAGALRGHCRAVIGVARRAETVQDALARGLVSWATTDLAEGVSRGPARAVRPAGSR